MNVKRAIALATLSVLTNACSEPVSPTSRTLPATRSSVEPSIASSNLTVSPASLFFGPTAFGSFDYDIVTISNTGDAADYITTATATPDNTFFPTFAGTCNTSVDPDDPNDPPRNYYIPAGGSCTFQWGFSPPVRRPRFYAGSGTIYFDSGASLTITFGAFGIPH